MEKAWPATRGRERPRLGEGLGVRTRIALGIYLTVLIPYYLFMIFTAFKPALFAH